MQDQEKASKLVCRLEKVVRWAMHTLEELKYALN